MMIDTKATANSAAQKREAIRASFARAFDQAVNARIAEYDLPTAAKERLKTVAQTLSSEEIVEIALSIAASKAKALPAPSSDWGGH